MLDCAEAEFSGGFEFCHGICSPFYVSREAKSQIDKEWAVLR